MLLCWVINYLLTSLFFKWILSWGGAERIEGWKAFFLIHWLAGTWTADQIRFWALLVWIIVSLVFLWGLFVPEMREFFYSLKGLKMLWFYCPNE